MRESKRWWRKGGGGKRRGRGAENEEGLRIILEKHNKRYGIRKEKKNKQEKKVDKKQDERK